MDFIPGICAGISQTIVGHPIDTMKVLIQNKKPWIGLPIKDYYRGFKYPMITGMIFNGFIFPCHVYFYTITNSNFISGGITGACITPFIYTLENIKIKIQTKQPLNLSVLKNTNGYVTTTTRESLAMSIYLSSYEYARSYNISSFNSGCISGILNWGITYPIDVIKTRQISQNVSFLKAYKQGGLWKGLGVVLCRAMLVNGSLFYTRDKITDLIETLK
tara:strand:+ start:4721 stop:5374 length:654 start_codon:yes stop_codon:yes gene_type:complete